MPESNFSLKGNIQISKDALSPQLSLTVSCSSSGSGRAKSWDLAKWQLGLAHSLKQDTCNVSRGEAEQQAGSVCSRGVWRAAVTFQNWLIQFSECLTPCLWWGRAITVPSCPPPCAAPQVPGYCLSWEYFHALWRASALSLVFKISVKIAHDSPLSWMPFGF